MKLFRNLKGSAILPLMISTGAGVMFVFLYFNLANYTNASAALERAAAKATRCITSMDSDCVNYAQDGAPVPANIRWYGYRSNGGDNSVFVDVPMVDYDAQMYSQLFGAEYSAFATRSVSRDVSWNTYSVPSYRAYVTQNAYISAVGRLAGTTTAYYLTPQYADFPAVEKDKSKSDVDWLLSQPFGVSFEEAPLLTNSQVSIPEDTIAEVKTQWIQIPPIDPNSICGDASGAPCTAPNGTGADAQDQWYEYAYLAVKSFAKAWSASSRSSATLRWSQGDGLEGLRIFVSDSDGFRSYCLGGRDDSGVPPTPDSEWINLYLRGPENASGGDSPNDILAKCRQEGMEHYDNLRVKRGGSFQIVGYLKSTRGTVVAEPHFYYYFNDFLNTSTPAPIHCDDVKYSFPHDFPACETIEGNNCSYWHPIAREEEPVSYFHWLWLNSDCNNELSNKLSNAPKIIPIEDQVFWTESSRTTTCTNDGNSAPNPECSPESGYANVAFCENNIEKLKDTIHPQAGCQACDHIVERTANVTVAEAASCAGAQPNSNNFQCPNDFRYLSSDGNPRQTCEGLNSKLALVEESTKQLNKSQTANSLPTFGEQIKVAWSDSPTYGNWDFSWTRVGPNGKPVLYANAAEQRSYSLPREAAQKRYKRTIAPSYLISPSDFLDAVANDNQHPKSSLGWEDYLKNVNQNIKPVILDEHETATVLSGTMFDNVIAQPYWGQQLSGYEFPSLNCQADFRCPNQFESFNSETDFLRHFASSAIPEAGDPSYLFEWSAKRYFDILGTFSDLQEANDEISARGFAACTPFRSVCQNTMVGNGSAELIAEGPIETFAVRPAACSDGSYVNCYNEIETVYNPTAEGEVRPIVSKEVAKLAALNEVEHILPQFYGRLCNDGQERNDCIAVNVDDSLDDGNQASVTVSVELPITFPFSTILGKDTLHLSYTKSGVYETAMVGRDN